MSRSSSRARRASVTSGASGTAAPPPPRRSAEEPALAGWQGVSRRASPPSPLPNAPEPPVPRGRPARVSLPWTLRLGAWIVAVPLGLLVVGYPARKAGYLTTQKLIDVVIHTDLGRFVPLVVIVLLWALATALLVTIFIEGGRRWMLARSRKRDTAA
jgi:hypothetical protein